MPMRWGSSESSTTPMPSFLRASVSSCGGGQGSVETENTTHTSSGRRPALTFRMFCVSFHLLVHSLVSSRTCRRPQSHNGTQPHRPSGGWVQGEAGLTLASFWCSFSSMLRAVGESRRAI